MQIEIKKMQTDRLKLNVEDGRDKESDKQKPKKRSKYAKQIYNT